MEFIRQVHLGQFTSVICIVSDKILAGSTRNGTGPTILVTDFALLLLN